MSPALIVVRYGARADAEAIEDWLIGRDCAKFHLGGHRGVLLFETASEATLFSLWCPYPIERAVEESSEVVELVFSTERLLCGD